MSKDLLETLDALQKERPAVLKSKRKYFDSENTENLNKKERLEWMRLRSEKDRVEKYKLITVGQTKLYYNILEQFVKMLDHRKELASMPSGWERVGDECIYEEVVFQ